MVAKKNKKLKLLKGEKAMYVLLLFLLLAIPMFNVYTSSLLSETNNEVEKLNKNIEKQELVNQGLSMQIDELASLENIQSIAEENGLSYNNSNIKSVGE
jgi:cell division protein FtsL